MEKIWTRHYDPGVPTELTYPDWTLYDLVRMTAEKKPHDIATSYNDQEISYRDLKTRIDSLAAGLTQLGVQKGDIVALVLPNSPTYIIAYYAVLSLGAIVANINVMLHGSELRRILVHSDARMVVTIDLFLKNVMDVVEETGVEKVLIHSVFGAEKDIEKTGHRPPVFHVNDLIEQNKNEFSGQAACTPDDIAVLQYTSGVTGIPKAAVLTHRSIIANLIQIDSWQTVKTDENRAVICIIPFFHVFGMTISMHVSVYCAYKMILFPMFDWSSIINILGAIRKHRPISFPAVPALWSALLSSSETKKKDLASIEIASGGGAPLTEETQLKFFEFTGKYISQAYGLSEVSSTAMISPFINGKITESVGLPLPDTDVRIFDIETGRKELSVGESGEIAISGPQVMSAYWKDDDKTRNSLRNGWLYTGDLGYMDQDGYFYLVDRKDDLIISKGFNVYPSQIEDVLVEHEAIREAVVVGENDPVRGQNIVAYLVVESGKKPDRKTILNHCRERLADYQIPRSFKFKDELPYNKLGKPLRRVLREETNKNGQTD